MTLWEIILIILYILVILALAGIVYWIVKTILRNNNH